MKGYLLNARRVVLVIASRRVGLHVVTCWASGREVSSGVMSSMGTSV